MKAPASVRAAVAAAFEDLRREPIEVPASALRAGQLFEANHDFSYAEMAKVHEALMRLTGRDDRSRLHAITFGLWGGTDAVRWSTPDGLIVPVAAAEVSATWLARLNVRLRRIDQNATSQVVALAEAAVRSAARSSSAVIANLLVGPRASAKLRDKVDDSTRSALAEACEFRAFSCLAPVLADEVRGTVTARVEAAVADFERDISAALSKAQTDVVRVLDAEIGLSDDLRDELTGWFAAALPVAVGYATETVTGYVWEAMSDGEGLPTVDPDFGRTVIAAAGSGEVWAPAERAARPSKIGSSERVRAIMEAAFRTPPDEVAVMAREQRRLHGRFIAADAVVMIETFWTSTLKQCEAHTALDGKGWVSEEERREVCAWDSSQWPHADPLFPGDHKGCACYLDDGYRVESESGTTTRRFST